MEGTGIHRLASGMPAGDRRYLEVQDENDEGQCLERSEERHDRDREGDVEEKE